VAEGWPGQTKKKKRKKRVTWACVEEGWPGKKQRQARLKVALAENV